MLQNSEEVNLNQVKNLITQQNQDKNNFTTEINMNSNKITHLKSCFDDSDAAKVAQTRNCGGHKITSLARSSDVTGAVNYSQLSELSETMNDCFKN